MAKTTKGEMKMDIRMVVFPDDNAWVAQCLEYDIGAQGDSVEEVTARFEAALMANILESIKRTGEPFGGIDPAPEYFNDKWNSRVDGYSGHKQLPVDDQGHVELELALCA